MLYTVDDLRAQIDPHDCRPPRWTRADVDERFGAAVADGFHP
jgi:hypothetical protein